MGRMGTRSRTPQSGRAEDAKRSCSAMSKDAGLDARLSRWTLERPGTDQPAEQTSTLGRLTPARYRFSAAAADSAYHASTNNGPCLEITPAVRCRTSLALMHKRPMGCREVLSRQGESVHSFQRHSPRTCRIPPERRYLLVQSAASLQRFALGSDAASAYCPSLSVPSPLPSCHEISNSRPSLNGCSPSISGS